MILLSELFAKNVRPKTISTLSFLTTILALGPILRNHIGYSGSIFSAKCLLGTVYILSKVPEIKSLQEIHEILNNKTYHSDEHS